MENDPPVSTDVQLTPVNFEFQSHDWWQEGTHLMCEGITCPIGNRHGHVIAQGLMLEGQRGSWRLVSEQR